MVGFGWRSLFFARVVAANPGLFRVCGVVKPNRRGAEQIEREWGYTVYSDAASLVRDQKPDFFVVSVPASDAADIAIDLSSLDVPILLETPPAKDVETLTRISKRLSGFKIQVAEQYMFQPYHAAVLAAIDSGLLGSPTHVNVSVAHGYHGVSMIRHLLGVDMDDCWIDGRVFESDLVGGPTREGPPSQERSAKVVQTIALLEFAGASAVFDFTQQQYMSWIRGHRVLVRGPRGEIMNREVRYLRRFDRPLESEFVRHDAGLYGNLEGYYHQGFTLDGQWLYRNPFAPARLSDDEIAVATCMAKMAEFVRGGQPFYSLDQACQDTYIALRIQEATRSGDRLWATAADWKAQ
jgi:predicted dehydrogenase